MTNDASILAPASRIYREATIDPGRWTIWAPGKGDILVCTPSKCGTTWTQTILAMLVHGGQELPERISALSPWVDADGGSRPTTSRPRAPPRKDGGSSRRTPLPMVSLYGRM
jgi:aryl sulfotransferase